MDFLNYTDWQDTADTLHMLLQMSGKVKYIYVFILLATILLVILLYDNIMQILLTVNYDFFSFIFCCII